LRRENEFEENENLSEEHGERRNLDSFTNQNLMNLAESRDKKREEKKISVWNMDYVEKLKKQPSFLCKGGENNSDFFASMILLIYKEGYFYANKPMISFLKIFLTVYHN